MQTQTPVPALRLLRTIRRYSKSVRNNWLIGFLILLLTILLFPGPLLLFLFGYIVLGMALCIVFVGVQFLLILTCFTRFTLGQLMLFVLSAGFLVALMFALNGPWVTVPAWILVLLVIYFVAWVYTFDPELKVGTPPATLKKT